MSIKAMNWAWAQKGLKPAQKLVLMKLADHSNDDGVCWPGKGSLSEDCAVSKRTLDGIMQYLVETKRIVIERRRDDSNPRHNYTNVYYLQIEQQELIPSANIALGQKLHQCKNSKGVVQKTAVGSAEIAPEPKSNLIDQPPAAARGRAREAAAIDYANWQPDRPILERIRQDNPDITDAFIESERLEFVTWAEDHEFQPRHLRTKFIAQVRRHWPQALQREGNRGPLRKIALDIREVPLNQLQAWSLARDGPRANPGESEDDYRKRIVETLSKRERNEPVNAAAEAIARGVTLQ